MTFKPDMVELYCKRMIGKGVYEPAIKVRADLQHLAKQRLVITHNGGLIPREMREWGFSPHILPNKLPNRNHRKMYPILVEALRVSRERRIEPHKIMIGDEINFKDRISLPDVVVKMEKYLCEVIRKSSKEVFHEIWREKLEREAGPGDYAVSDAFSSMFEEWYKSEFLTRLKVTDTLKAERDANASWGAW